eukprot:CAMPEP_0175105536 /NCGR_PEP_ID=MMETSP0086_2-20121207/10526_1 /TAXON_ID=136419 /ORGANISM="Unknown Unknown, Strain D1" /LENGTH=70 /DNA_ID=CAMNT_0016381427 /DNA_START=132 /DNA_END=341 /DNA_ORIENTATION=+
MNANCFDAFFSQKIEYKLEVRQFLELRLHHCVVAAELFARQGFEQSDQNQTVFQVHEKVVDDFVAATGLE